MPSGVYHHKSRLISERFWDKVDKRSDNECWEWKAYKTPEGYGQFGVKNIIFKAHRVAWMLHTGDTLYNGEFVLHKCDNPSCVNPNHLFLGNNQLNMADKASKGRSNGELNNSHKLTEQQVIQIRQAHQNGTTKYKLARKYDVSNGCITKIVTRQTWRHIE